MDYRERASELEFLKWVWLESDIHPVKRDNLKRWFIEETGKDIPEGWNYWSDGKTTTDNYNQENKNNEND